MFPIIGIGQNTIVSNSFDNSSDWIIGAPNLQGQWQVQATTPADVTQYMGAMASASASNGFGVFNAIQYLINGPVNDQDATLELNNTIDLTNYPAVLIEFEQRYKKFNYDETFIEFSTDNGTTWPSSLAIPLNTQAVTNNPAVQELVAINISSYVGGQSSVRVRFRWKSISSASANPNGFGSGYGWMVDDLKVTVPNSNDLQNLSSWIFGELSSGAEYGRTPIAQVEPNYYVGASVYNFGSTAQFNVVVSGDFNGPTNFTTTASIASILTDSTKRIESLLPLNFGVGVYNGTFTVTSDSDQVGGPNFGDNIQLRNFEITNNIYSLDGIGNHPVGTEILGSIGTTSFTGAEDGLICATMFPFYANDTINSVKFLIDSSNSNAGAEIILRIIDSTSFRDQLFNNAIFSSNIYVVTASDISQGFIEIPVGNISSNGLLFESLPISAGNYYIAIEMFSFTNVYDIAIIDDKTVGQPAWSSAIFIPNDQNYTNGTAFAIRLNLGDSSYSTCSNTFSTDNKNVCGSFTWINGNTYTSSNNTATYTLTNAAGCDSIISLNLTILPNQFGTDFAASQLLFTSLPFVAQFTNNTPNPSNYNFTWDFGDGTILQSNNTNVFHDFLYDGLYSVSLIAQDINTGCADTMYKQDYIYTTGGNTNCNNTGTDIQNTCGSFTWIDGNTYNASNNTATFTLTNAAGCDSVVTLNLTINQTSSSIDNQILCDGNTLNWIDGNTYTSSNNTATYTLTNTDGCDSIVSLNLTVSSFTSTLLTISSCGSYIFNGQSLSTTGMYVDTNLNAAGCPQIDSLDLTITTVGTTTVQSSCDSFLWNGTVYNTSGTYTSSSGGNCVDSLVLTISEFLTNFTASPTLITSPPFNVTFNNTTPNISNYNFTWDLGDGTIGQTNIPSFVHQYMSNGIYDVSLIAEDITNNCGYDTLKIDNLISCSGGSGTSINEKQKLVNIYPNPTNENIKISIENFNGNIQTEVYDLIGNRLQTTSETTISLSDYARGIYLLKVAYGDRVEEVKVIKQ